MAAAGLVLFAITVIALQDALVRLAGHQTSLWQFQLLRSTCNIVLIFAIARVAWGGWPRRPERLWAVALRSVLLLGAMVFFFAGVPELPMAEMAAGLYTFPIFVTIFSWAILGEKVGPWRVAAVAIAALGAVLILQPGTESFHWKRLLPVVGGLCYAGMIIVTRRHCRTESPVTLALGVALTLVAAGTTGIGVLALAPAGEAARATLPFVANGWVPLVWEVVALAAAASVLNLTANVSLARAYQSAEASWLAPFDYGYLVMAVLWGYVVFGELPGAITALGMALVAAGGALTAWRERRRGRPAPTPAPRR